MLPFLATAARVGARYGWRFLMRSALAGHSGPGMPAVSIALKGVDSVLREVEAFHRRGEKAMQIAIRTEAFRLRSLMQKEIRAGAPGGQRFERLTYMARRKRGRRSWLPDKPLARLAQLVRYDVLNTNPYTVALGWTDRTPRRIREIVMRQQRGFSSPVSERRESYFRHRGDELGPRSQNKKYFFLRRGTTRFKTPARQIIEPFAAKHQMEIMRNIRMNFRTKMAGGRI